MTEKIKQQILRIRDTGETNMLDSNRVQQIANREGYYDLVVYIEEHRNKYFHFIMTGEDGEAKAYTDFVFALLNMAKQKKRIIAKPYDGDNDKFTMRLFLVQLGLKGEKYKNTRKILLRYLTGNSAWRNGVSHESEGLK